MATWLDEIRAELDLETVEAGDPLEPGDEIGPGDHEIGMADPEHMRLYVIARRWQKAGMTAAVEAKFAGSVEEREELQVMALQLYEKSDILLTIFWVSIKDSLELWDKPSIGIRKGWKIVWSENDVPPFLQLLGGFGGGE